MTAHEPDRPNDDARRAAQSAAPGEPDTRAAAREAADSARQLGRQLRILTLGMLRSGWRRGRVALAGSAVAVRAASQRLRTRVPARSDGEAPVEADAKPSLGARRIHPALAAGIVAVVLPLLFAAYLVAQAAITLPPLGGVVPEGGQRALTVEADDGRVFATRGVFRGEKLDGKDIPAHLAQAIVAIEDRRFYSHWGVDLRGMARAVWRNLRGGGVREGASTLTQQYVRMISLSQEKTLHRKIQEALLAFKAERTMSKEEILTAYLNTAYFGAGAYGVDAAARRYFGHPAKSVTLPEAAMLAGLVRAPSQLAPTRNFGGAKERADLVLQTMVETGAITSEEADKARAQSVSLRIPPETPPGTNYLLDMVAGDAKRLTDETGDLTLRTTLNLELQGIAESVVARLMDAEGEKKRAGQAALVAMRKDGAILALVGGRDYEDSQFNRVTQAKRQAGSLFKLFVYLAAYEKGFDTESVLVDRPVQIGEWEPQNANNRFRGPVNLRSAFALSINTIAAQLADEIGTQAVIDTARRLGVESELPNVPSLALGVADVSLIEMTRAYAGVLTGAPPVAPFAVHAIRGGDPKPLYAHPDAKAAVTLQQEPRQMMLDSLEAVVEGGTGKAARLPGVAVGGKTGTSQDYRDAWFVGVSPDMVVGVWVGNDDNTPMNKVTGGDLPARIFHDFLQRSQQALKGRKRPAPSAAKAERAPASDVAPTPASNDLRGVPEVIDTGTLSIRGKVVQLAGLQGEAGPMAQQLARYLRRREVACSAAPAGNGMRCRLDGDDLATLILSGGGARAVENAPQDLVEAEDQARAERAGLWGRGR